MAVEGPIATAFISRLPHAKENTAAFLVLLQVAIWIEAPVIDLLTVGTALARSRSSYLKLCRYVAWMMALVTFVHVGIAVTPLWDMIVVNVMGVPTHVADAARPGMLIMSTWSAAIGWRRYHQGLMIRHGETRPISYGTFIRIFFVLVIGLVLLSCSRMTGLEVGAWSLAGAVFVEAVYVHLVSRDVVRGHYRSRREPHESEPMTTNKLLGFHLPLLATTLIVNISGPLISSSLARTSDSVLALAAWQVAMTFVWLTRTITFALPEVVIALYRDERSAQKLRRFSMGVGALTGGALVFTGFTGLDVVFYRHVLGAAPDVCNAAHVATIASGLMPIINAPMCYIRGMLTAHHLTFARLLAIVVSVSTLAVGLFIGLALKAPPMLFGAFALTAMQVAELAVLAVSWRIGRTRSCLPA